MFFLNTGKCLFSVKTVSPAPITLPVLTDVSSPLAVFNETYQKKYTFHLRLRFSQLSGLYRPFSFRRAEPLIARLSAKIKARRFVTKSRLKTRNTKRFLRSTFKTSAWSKFLVPSLQVLWANPTDFKILQKQNFRFFSRPVREALMRRADGLAAKRYFNLPGSLFFVSNLFFLKQYDVLLSYTPDCPVEAQPLRVQSGIRWLKTLRTLVRPSRVIRRHRFIFKRVRRYTYRVASWFWWHIRHKWHGYWLIKRKWKFQKKFIPLRKMKFSLVLRRPRWIYYSKRFSVYSFLRNPARGDWWAIASQFPKRRRYLAPGMVRRFNHKFKLSSFKRWFVPATWAFFLTELQQLDSSEQVLEEKEEDDEDPAVAFIEDNQAKAVGASSKKKKDDQLDVPPPTVFDHLRFRLAELAETKQSLLAEELPQFLLDEPLKNNEKFEAWSVKVHRTRNMSLLRRKVVWEKTSKGFGRQVQREFSRWRTWRRFLINLRA